MNEEVMGGLRNALDRGESIESAVKSMISAGYNVVEVREAAEALSSASISRMTSVQKEKDARAAGAPEKPYVHERLSPPENNSINNVPQNPETIKNKSSYDEMIEDKKKKSSLTMKTMLIIMLIILIVVIAGSALLILFFPDLTPTFIKNIIGR